MQRHCPLAPPPDRDPRHVRHPHSDVHAPTAFVCPFQVCLFTWRDSRCVGEWDHRATTTMTRCPTPARPGGAIEDERAEPEPTRGTARGRSRARGRGRGTLRIDEGDVGRGAARGVRCAGTRGGGRAGIISRGRPRVSSVGLGVMHGAHTTMRAAVLQNVESEARDDESGDGDVNSSERESIASEAEMHGVRRRRVHR